IAELAIELGKAHIVANRQRETPEGALHRDRALPRLERARLVVALVACLEAEQMHFVVARHPPPGIVEHQAGAADAARVRTRYGGGAADSRARHGYLLSGTTSSLSRVALTPILATFGSSQVPLIE